MQYSEYEKTRKCLMRLTSFVIEASRDPNITLEQKIARIQAGKELQKALNIIRLNHFKIEDIINAESADLDIFN